MNITMQFTQADMDAIRTRTGEFTPLLLANLAAGEYHQLQIVQSRAVAYMWEMFKAGTGELEDGFDPIAITVQANQVFGTLSNSLPWAWRREEGFSGRTDRLGRYYKKDPGIHYMRWALTAQRDAIAQGIQQAVQDTLAGQTTRA